MTLTFRDGNLDEGDGARLEAAMRAEVEAMYAGLDMRAADMPAAGAAELGPPHGVFLVGDLDGEAVCCGGIKRLSEPPEAICEFKRMYVAPSARGRGIGRALLAALEGRARAMEYAVARLDTGSEQPAAQRLYLSAGYEPIENFNGNPVATFFAEKRLASDAYPPPPWDLLGQSHMHALLVPKRDLPLLPVGFRPVVLAGRAVVLTGVVDYRGGSVLQYGEMFAAVVGTTAEAPRRPVATVTHMWVDSPASRRGGRELWGYPKELASFVIDIGPGGTASAALDDGAEIARSTYQPRVELPRPVRARTGTVQPLDGRLVPVRALVRARLSVGPGRFTAPVGSPLGWTASGRRVVSFGLRDFSFRFGI